MDDPTVSGAYDYDDFDAYEAAFRNGGVGVGDDHSLWSTVETTAEADAPVPGAEALDPTPDRDPTTLSSDRWLVNLKSVAERAALPRDVEIRGWVLNVTKLVDDLPFGQYAFRINLTAQQWYRLAVTLVIVLMSTHWVVGKYQRWRRGQRGWYLMLQESKHRALILPPECVHEAPLRSPITRVTRKVMRKISRHTANGGDNHPIISIDPSFLPDDASPLLVFVNSRSGGQLGGYLTSQLKQNLNPLQVVDLHKTDPKFALRLFSNLPKLRIMVCGGDGTVAWILQALEELVEIDPKPPVGILPLGTGNDLARVLGWGGGYYNDLVSELLVQIQEAHPAVLDRWEVGIIPADPEGPPPSPKKRRRHRPGTEVLPAPAPSGSGESGSVVDGSVHGAVTGGGGGGGGGGGAKTLVFQNYLGIGVDAQAALRFHRTRNIRPHLFFSATTNKILYGLFGARDFVEHSCAGMNQHVHVIADGVRRDLPPETEGIILLNINSFAGGVRMWEGGDGHGNSSMQDGMVDVVVVFGALHLGQLNWGVDKPVRICQARDVKVIVEKGFPMHVDGEPWEQPACTIDIKLRNKALMLRRTADASGMTVKKMADTLEWARKHEIISNDQREMIMNEAYRRAESDRSSGSQPHSRSASLGNLFDRHMRAKSGSSIEDFY